MVIIFNSFGLISKYTYFFLECKLQFSLQIFYKLIYPPVVFVVVLAVADEDIIFVTFDYA